MASDRDLIERITEREGDAFDELFDRYEAMIHRHLMRYVRSDAAAQDLLQEVFLRVWTRGEQGEGRGAFKAWLYRIATNTGTPTIFDAQPPFKQPPPPDQAQCHCPYGHRQPNTQIVNRP